MCSFRPVHTQVLNSCRFLSQQEHQQEQTPAEQSPTASTSAPFDFELSPSQPFSAAPPPPLRPPDLSIFLKQPKPAHDAFSAPSPLGLPVYSASGFDLLSILARVATRPNPKVVLGPVDLTCSFVVVDTRRFDHPIVYCSPTFCSLTGYPESEILGRNCRFLQAPGGDVQRGEPRNHTTRDAVALLRKSLMADKECQTSIVNYKKDGSPFINLVTVIPVPGGLSGAQHEENDYIYQVGFQVDLNLQPHAILEKLRDGSYLVNYGVHSNLAPQHVARQVQSLQHSSNGRDKKANAIPPIVMSKELKRLMTDPAFLNAIPLSTSTTVSQPAPSSTVTTQEETAPGASHLLHLLLLEASPDFVHVVSLKGNFLYVAPSVRRVLGYEPDEMVGASISDFAHPDDVVPLMRELKEGSAILSGPENGSNGPPFPNMPRSVDLLFRAKTKMGRYVWVESRGRLHVEPGKGRKAIVLSGRAREMTNLKWEDVELAGGMAKVLEVENVEGSEKSRLVDQEVWGMLAGTGNDTLTFMSVGRGVEDVLGWSPEDLLGRSVSEIITDASVMNVLGGIVAEMRVVQEHSNLLSRRVHEGARVKRVQCSLRKKDGGAAEVWFIIYRADPDNEEDVPIPPEESTINNARGASLSISPSPLVYQIRLVDAETLPTAPECVVLSTGSTSTPLASTSAIPSPAVSTSDPSSSSSPPSPPRPSIDMFEELAISRGSSWQYELQQLRFANLRLQEELAALEAADAAVGGSGVSLPKPANKTSCPQPPIEMQTAPYYEPLGSYAEQYKNLFPDYSLQTFSESPTTQHEAPYAVQLPSQPTPIDLGKRPQQRIIHPRPPNQVQAEWSSIAHSPQPGRSSLLKRSWDASIS